MGSLRAECPWGVLISSWGTWHFVMGHFVLPMGRIPAGNGANSICQYRQTPLLSAEYLVERCELAVLLDRTEGAVASFSAHARALLIA